RGRPRARALGGRVTARAHAGSARSRRRSSPATGAGARSGLVATGVGRIRGRRRRNASALWCRGGGMARAVHQWKPRLTSTAACSPSTSRRGDEPEYTALITSAYVREGGEWKLTFHQQTPS